MVCFPTKKRAAYLPGTDDEQASAQNKREKNGMIIMPDWKQVLFFVFFVVFFFCQGPSEITVHQTGIVIPTFS